MNLNKNSWEITDMFLSYQDIKDICKHRNDKGTISLYVYSSTNETEREFRIRLNSLGDMIKFGVLVPTKVERIALQNGASIASLLLTTDAIVSEIPEKKKKSPGLPAEEEY